MNASRQMIGAVILSMVFAATAAVALTLPQAEGFNNTDLGWTQGPNATYTFEVGGIEGSHFRRMREAIDDAKLSLSFSAAAQYTNVWWRGFAVVTPEPQGREPLDADIEDAVAAFFVRNEDSDGTWVLHARNGGAWVNVHEFTTANPTTEWVGYAVHLDYNTSSWDLYVNEAGTLSGTLTKVNTAGSLGFNTHGTQSASLTDMVVKYDTDIDGFNFLVGYADVDANSPTSIAPATVTYPDGTWIESRVSDKEYATGQNNLGAALGVDLAMGLVPGDRLQVYTTAGWQEYFINTVPTWEVAQGANPGDLVLEPGTPIWIKYIAPRVATFALYESEWVPQALETQTSEKRETLSFNTGTSAAGGWTPFKWDSNKTKSIENVGFPTGDILSGTVIFVIGSDGRFVRGYWTGSTWETVGGTPIILRPGNTVWIYRTDDTVITWEIDY